MTDGKIRIKHLGGTLALRVILVSLALLVIPLFLHSLFLYREEYKSTLEDVKENLNLAAKADVALLEERLALQWQMLDMNPDLGVPINTPVGSADHFVYFRRGYFYVGKKITLSDSKAFKTSANEVMQELTSFEKGSYPFSLAILDAQGNVLVGSKISSPLFEELPIKNADFSLYLSIPIETIEKLHKEWYLFHFLSLLFFVGLIGGFLVWLVTRRISRPLKELCKSMQKVGDGAFHVRYTPDRMGFEINALGKQFNTTLDQLFEKTKEAQKEKMGRERLAEELKIGREIQHSLFPKELPEFQGLDIAAGFLPARQVGGDFYDLFPLDDGRLMIAIADTAGKGISACLFSLGLRAMLRTLAAKGENITDIILNANDLFFKDAYQKGMFITLWLGIYDPKTNGIEFCSQGHPAAYLLKEGSLEKLWTPGIAMGASKLDTVETKKEKLEKGDILILYTDGIIEAHDMDENIFGVKKLEEFLLLSPKTSMHKFVDRTIKEVENFCQNAPQHDDITILFINLLK